MMNKSQEEFESLEAELLEQCRLLGKSSEREAKHLSIIETLKRENLKLSKENSDLRKLHNEHIDSEKALDNKTLNIQT
jgi:hypothetical protein